jgi:hypothetical protein
LPLTQRLQECPKLTEKEENQLAVTREVMDRYHVALSVLAKGDASPHMTEELKAQLVEAEKRLEKYRVTKSDRRMGDNFK